MHTNAQQRDGISNRSFLFFQFSWLWNKKALLFKPFLPDCLPNINYYISTFFCLQNYDLIGFWICNKKFRKWAESPFIVKSEFKCNISIPSRFFPFASKNSSIIYSILFTSQNKGFIFSVIFAWFTNSYSEQQLKTAEFVFRALISIKLSSTDKS